MVPCDQYAYALTALVSAAGQVALPGLKELFIPGTRRMQPAGQAIVGYLLNG
jgi:hypothetical protein